MTPVIRIDDEVMDKLKKEAIRRELVFSTPNEVIRAILGLDKETKSDKHDNRELSKFVDIEIRNLYTPLRWALIPIPKAERRFFPGYKLAVVLDTDVGELKTHVTSAPKGTPIGDPDQGKYIQGGLRIWYNNHPELEDGTKLRIEALEPGKRYKLSIVSKGV